LRLIDADALAPTLDPLALVEAMREAHRAGAMGEVERLLVEEGDSANSALTWLAWDRTRGVAVKTATVFPSNSAAGAWPNVQSVVVLFDGGGGRPLAAIHGESFTRMKTAADSALGCDLLARKDAATLAVLGAGGQARTHIRFLRAVRPSLAQVLVWNRTATRAERLAASLRDEGLAARAVAGPEEAVRQADVVSCLTASAEPVLSGAWLKLGAHVDLVGGFTPAMREADDETMRRGRLFADTLRFTVTACGDFADPIARGVIVAEAVEGDLFGLCSGRVAGRRSQGDITVFKNGGGGHLDLIVARALHDAAASPSPARGRGPG
jgi:ornithine cyclodeaminase/alanine dehydrogenase-like protein (mu-crystallin family)